MAILLVTVIYWQMSDFYRFPTVTSVNVRYVTENDFPAVTICDLNVFNKQFIEQVLQCLFFLTLLPTLSLFSRQFSLHKHIILAVKQTGFSRHRLSMKCTSNFAKKKLVYHIWIWFLWGSIVLKQKEGWVEGQKFHPWVLLHFTITLKLVRKVVMTEQTRKEQKIHKVHIAYKFHPTMSMFFPNQPSSEVNWLGATFQKKTKQKKRGKEN